MGNKILFPAASSIVLRSADADIHVNSSLLLSCVANGRSEISWRRFASNSSDVPLTRNITTRGTEFVISTLVLCKVGFADAGMYSCVVDDDEASIAVQVHCKF